MANGAELNFFSIRLRELREAAGCTLQKFAEAIGVSRQTVYLWESGAGFPEVGKLQAISGVLGVSIAAPRPGRLFRFLSPRGESNIPRRQRGPHHNSAQRKSRPPADLA